MNELSFVKTQPRLWEHFYGTYRSHVNGWLLIRATLLLFLLLLSFRTQAKCTVEVQMDGAIGFVQLDRLERAIHKAQAHSCESVLVLINTPGGVLQSARKIVERILNSPLPILCLVYPSGGHAGSAGAIILQACHVAGAMEATNIGAATPVSGSGQDIQEDMKKKMLNDTKSWLEGLTKLRERNHQFGQEIITKAKAVSAKEALKINAIDFVAQTKDEFLEFSKGRQVKMAGKRETQVAVGPLMVFGESFRDEVMSILMDPQMAYMMFMASLGLIYFEITHPGTMIPGVIGGIGLVISLVSLHKMDVTWGALLLIVLGLIFMIMEAFMPSFGILGMGGVASFFLGSMFLFDEQTGIELPLSLILPTTILLGTLTLGLAVLLCRTRSVRKQGASDELLGKKGVVLKGEGSQGLMAIHGETWQFKCPEGTVQPGELVEVEGYEGLTLVVKK